MARDPDASAPGSRGSRVPPYSEEAERGVLGSILLDPMRTLDLAVENQVVVESFYVPAHRIIYDAMLQMMQRGQVIDILTLGEFLRGNQKIKAIGGAAVLDQLVDSTPTAAHAEYYIDLVRQKHLLRCVISCAQEAELSCYGDVDDADVLLSNVEQNFLDITENQHGSMMQWGDAVEEVMSHVEKVFTTKRGIGDAVSTGFQNLDRKLTGLRRSEMIVLAARPSMGKTSLAMNIAENVGLGKGGEGEPTPVCIFSLEMSCLSLVTRMLCCYAAVPGFRLAQGYVSDDYHKKLVNAAAVLRKAPIYLDDTGGLDVLELRARARRMYKKHSIKLIVVDYLQLLNCREYARQGRQLETSAISANLKAMAKELNVPVLVLSQLSRAPEQRDKHGGKPKLSDLRDSGAIEQDADVVMMLRRPCKYPDTEGSEDETLAIVDIVKHRNGPTGEVELNFEDEYTRFRDRAHGVDSIGGPRMVEEEDL